MKLPCTEPESNKHDLFVKNMQWMIVHFFPWIACYGSFHQSSVKNCIIFLLLLNEENRKKDVEIVSDIQFTLILRKLFTFGKYVFSISFI